MGLGSSDPTPIACKTTVIIASGNHGTHVAHLCGLTYDSKLAIRDKQ